MIIILKFALVDLGKMMLVVIITLVLIVFMHSSILVVYDSNTLSLFPIT
jgi:hypothetical protein